MRPGETTRSPQVDVCFVFDTTGSMSNKIDGLVQCVVDLVNELAALELDWRVTTVPFGDLTVPGDRIVVDQPFLNSREAAERQIRSMPRFSGGGNLGESSMEAVHAGLLKDFRNGAVRVLVLLTDEPALTGPQVSTKSLAASLKQANVVVFVAAPDYPYFRDWARENGGEWYLIGPSMDTEAILQMLRSLVRRVAKVARDVHAIGGGSVGAYLALEQGRDASD